MSEKRCRRCRRLDRAERAAVERGLDRNRSAREMAADLARGLSPEQICLGRAAEFKVSAPTLYRWIDRGYAGMSNMDLRRKVGYKERGLTRPRGRRPTARRGASALAAAAMAALGCELLPCGELDLGVSALNRARAERGLGPLL